MYDAELSIPTEVTPPILHTILHDRGHTPVVGLMETLETLSIDSEVAVELRVLTLKKLPQGCPHTDNTCEEVSVLPVIGIHRSELIYSMISEVST